VSEVRKSSSRRGGEVGGFKAISRQLIHRSMDSLIVNGHLLYAHGDLSCQFDTHWQQTVDQ